jgi:hypothetical protein
MVVGYPTMRVSTAQDRAKPYVSWVGGAVWEGGSVGYWHQGIIGGVLRVRLHQTQKTEGLLAIGHYHFFLLNLSILDTNM